MKLLDIFPLSIRQALQRLPNLDHMIEVVVDLGRPIEVRFDEGFQALSDRPATLEDIAQITSRLSPFGRDNRAGIEHTLHRISAIRNRSGAVVGLTCRVGRAVTGTIDILLDVITAGKSVCLLGPPGVGKTTMLRECARLLAEQKRVVIVDTSSEIAGDGDIPHRGIGRARRMQVADPALQHAVMIEAVENHMPQVVVIDEIGTEAEALAARTIAERGVQLIGTAHGKTIQNLLMNPTLSDLLGGINTVTLSDDEARRRGTRKTVLERKLPPTFDVVVEILERDKLAIHVDTATVIDAMLRGTEAQPEIRRRLPGGGMAVEQEAREQRVARGAERFLDTSERAGYAEDLEPDEQPLAIFPYGVSRNKIERAIRNLGVNAEVARKWDDADIVVTLKSMERKDSTRLRSIASEDVPIHAIKTNTTAQIMRVLHEIFEIDSSEDEELGVREAQDAITRVLSEESVVELTPQNSFIRRMQHELAEKSSVQSRSTGAEPNRRVRIFRGYDAP